MSTTSYFHAVNAGDLIATMAGLRNRFEKFKETAVVYQKIDHLASYYPGAIHPTKNANGTMVCMNDEIFDKIKPLILAQPYMSYFEKFDGQPFTVDLHRCHNGLNVNMPKGIIQKWTWYGTPDLSIGKGLANSWISVPFDNDINEHFGFKDRRIEDCIIINFTQRYRNFQINYFFLKQYESRLIFNGTQEEYELFCTQWKLKIPLLKVDNFLQLAQVMKQSVGFIGNSSMCWNIAEAMKIPRALEYCVDVPCCFAITKDDDFGVEYLYEGEIQYYIQEMFNTFGKLPDNIFYECPVCSVKNNSIGSKKNTKYYRCKSCGTLYCPPINQSGMLGGLHELETEARSNQDQERVLRFKELALGGKNILDYGCGKEHLVKTANSQGFIACGYDPYNPEINKLPNGKFDLISMVEVVEHLSPPFSEFDDIYNLLRNDHFLYIETSFSDWVNIDNDYCDPEKGHCTIFSHKSLKMLLEKKGFKHVGYINQNTLIFKKNEHNKESTSESGSKD